jgi:hypothetical protein
MAGYTEQAGAKANMGELEYLDPLSSEFLGKLEHIRGAVVHHMYEEESDRFLDLKNLPSSEQARLTARYMEEFDRYVDPGHESNLEWQGRPPSQFRSSPLAIRSHCGACGTPTALSCPGIRFLACYLVCTRARSSSHIALQRACK